MLEKPMNCQLLLDDPVHIPPSHPAEDLIREIALLESQILYVEKYLLSLYRKSFSKRLPSTISSRRVEGEEDEEEEEPHSMMISSEVAKTNSESMNGECSSFLRRNISSNTLTTKRKDILSSDTLIDSGICRSHSSLSQHSACSFLASPPFEPVSEALDAYHSLPLSILERINDCTSSANISGNLASSYLDRVRETPNWLSEEMIKCMSAIYRHLSHPPSTISQRGHKSCEDYSSFESWLKRPSHSETSKQLSGSLFATVEIHDIFRDTQKLNSVQELVKNYRSLISKLALVDPRRLRHVDKLAFWTNVHNALVMHAFMVYGIPRGNLKRMSLVLKAAYNIGGHTISVDTIQNSILGCRLPRPTPWLHLLFYPKTKFKAGDPRKAFIVKQPEPRLHFALCSGCQSDPAVRLYTPKKVFQELEMAKEEYIRTNIRLNKEQRLMVPKIVEYYIKEMGGLSRSGVPEIIDHSMPDSLRNLKLWKKVDWIPHNFAFRFLLCNELGQVISNQGSKV